MSSRYKILYNLSNNKLLSINIEYILRVKYFTNYKVYVFFPLLSPNQDTIRIVYIFKIIYSNTFLFYIADAGSGSGLISTLMNSQFKHISWNAIDKLYLSPKAFKLNIKNDNAYQIFCDWIYIFLSIKKFDIILTNPPYISYYDFSYYFNDYSFEIKNAVLSSNSGFSDIYNIIKTSYNILAVNGIMLVEHSYSQSKKIRKTMQNYGFNNICTYNDLNGLNRITYAEK